MFLAVLIISIAFGAEPEFQVISILLRAPANRAFVASYRLFSPLYTPHIGLSAMNLLRRIPVHIPHSKEENQKIPQGKKGHHTISRMYDDTNLRQAKHHIV